jgi:hypothetical protein
VLRLSSSLGANDPDSKSSSGPTGKAEALERLHCWWGMQWCILTLQSPAYDTIIFIYGQWISTNANLKTNSRGSIRMLWHAAGCCLEISSCKSQVAVLSIESGNDYYSY